MEHYLNGEYRSCDALNVLCTIIMTEAKHYIETEQNGVGFRIPLRRTLAFCTLAIMLSVLFRFTDSDYPYGIIKLFLSQLVMFRHC
jgi:hypothetical protein